MRQPRSSAMAVRAVSICAIFESPAAATTMSPFGSPHSQVTTSLLVIGVLQGESFSGTSSRALAGTGTMNSTLSRSQMRAFAARSVDSDRAPSVEGSATVLVAPGVTITSTRPATMPISDILTPMEAVSPLRFASPLE